MQKTTAAAATLNSKYITLKLAINLEQTFFKAKLLWLLIELLLLLAQQIDGVTTIECNISKVFSSFSVKENDALRKLSN